MSDPIPLNETSTIADLNDPYSLLDPFNGDDPDPFHDSDYISIGLRPVTIPATIDEPEYIEGDLSITYEVLKNALGRNFGRIRPWKGFTTYYGKETYRGIDLPPDIVEYNGELFITLETFNSDATFNERPGGNLVLSRVRLDTDPDYLEISGSANSPLLAGDKVIRYNTIRDVRVLAGRDLPNDRLLRQITGFNNAVCNGDITTDLVLTIKRYWDGGNDTVGTITFTPLTIPNAVKFVYGVYAFNDASLGAQAATGTIIDAGDLLVVEATTIPTEFSFVSITMLGDFINYQSPLYNQYVPV